MKIDKQKLYTLKDARNQVLEAADAALDAGNMEEYEAKLAEVKGYNAQIESVEKLLREQERFAGQEPGTSGGPGLEQQGQEDGYAKAVKSFADAARSGFRVAKAAGDMMQEGVDADGGYAVPQDIVTRIINLRDSKESLLSEVRTKCFRHVGHLVIRSDTALVEPFHDLLDTKARLTPFLE